MIKFIKYKFRVYLKFGFGVRGLGYIFMIWVWEVGYKFEVLDLSLNLRFEVKVLNFFF